jgi:hypothetical protein
MYAVLPFLALVPIVGLAYMFTNAVGGGSFNFAISSPLLFFFALNLAVFSLAAAYSLLYGANEARDQVINTGAYVFIASATALLFCMILSKDRYPIVTLMSGLYFATFAICFLNLLLVAAGLENPAAASQPQTQSPSLLSDVLGLGIKRIMMPLSSAFQNGAVAPLALCVLSAGFSGRHKKLRALGFVLGALLLLLLDTRMFVFAGALAFAVRMVPSPKFVATTAIILPWLEVGFVSVSENFPTLSAFATGRTDKFGLFAGREFVWRQFWDYFDHATYRQILLGNGLFGQANAGISRYYADVFVSWQEGNRSTISLHNAFLQMTADTGLIGLAIFCVLLFRAVQRAEVFARANTQDASAWKALSLLLLSFASIAGTEMVIGWYMKESVSITVSLFLALGLFGGGAATWLQKAGPGFPLAPTGQHDPALV